MKHRFRLTPVLNHRIYLEEQAQQDFAEASRAVDEARAKLRRLQTRRTQYEKDLRDKQERASNVAEIVISVQYLHRLKHEIGLQQGVLAQLEDTRETKRELLLEAVKNRKAIEKLEEKQKADRRRNEKRNEKNLMDDISVARFAANRQFSKDKTLRTAKSTPTFSGKNFPERKSLPPKPPGSDRHSVDN